MEAYSRFRIKRGRTRNRPRRSVTIEDAALLRIEVEAGAYIAPEKTKFVDFIEEWRNKYVSNPKNLSLTTLTVYENVIGYRLIPTFKNDRIDQISTLKLVSFFTI
ncbi:hypothetical protein [Paenibacillus xylanexedens]|uniref:hypothetical protein n=1 Tax=Paenibacillus xylanexedens TaxID=528191 RepID=UPI003D061613